MPSIKQASLTLAVLLGLASQAVANPDGSNELATRDEMNDGGHLLERYDDGLEERDEDSEYLDIRDLLQLRGRVRPSRTPKKAGASSLRSKHAKHGGPFSKSRVPKLSKRPKKLGSLAKKKKPSGLLSKRPKRLGSLAKKRPSGLLSKPAKHGGPFAKKKKN